MTGDLCTPTFSYTSSGQIKVESKDDIRKRIQRSTDGADALGLALYLAHLTRANLLKAQTVKRVAVMNMFPSQERKRRSFGYKYRR